MKVCSRCHQQKEERDFQIRRASRDGLTAACRACLAEYDKERAGLPHRVGKLRVELEAAEKRIAELQLREVVLPQCYSMLHRVDFDEPYHTEMVYRQHQVLEALHNAGINVTEAGKGEAS